MYCHQRTRGTYFTIRKYLNKLIYPVQSFWYMYMFPKTQIHLNLGCGVIYLQGFVNVDDNVFQKLDLWLDLRNRFPFIRDKVSTIYCSHVLEHFYPDELQHVLRECYRVLKPGGGIRIVVPDLELAIKKYLEWDLEWFTNNPRQYACLGRKFSNLMLSDGSHRVIFDYSHLEKCLKMAGFGVIEKVSWTFSKLYARGLLYSIREAGKRVVDCSLFVEALK